MTTPRPVRQTPLAEADLVAIWSYVAVDNEAGADRIFNKILSAIAHLAKFPFMGKARDDALAGVRTLSVPPYIVAFRVTDELVEILRVFHGARDFATIDIPPDDASHR